MLGSICHQGCVYKHTLCWVYHICFKSTTNTQGNMNSKSFTRCAVILLLSASYCFAWSFYNRPERNSVDCIVGKWRSWSKCMLDFTDPFHFDVMIRNRDRPVIQWPRGRGKTCPPLQEIEECSGDSPLDCDVGEWSHWSYCSHESNSPNSRTIEERFRQIIVESKNGGRGCPELSEVRDCVMRRDDVNCQVSEWSDFSDCFDLMIPDGDDIQVRERVRVVEVDPQGQGEECPLLSETEICDEPSMEKSPKKKNDPKRKTEKGDGCRGSSGCSSSGSSQSGSPSGSKRRRGSSSSSGGSSKSGSPSGSKRRRGSSSSSGGSSKSESSSGSGKRALRRNHYYNYRYRHNGSSKK